VGALYENGWLGQWQKYIAIGGVLFHHIGGIVQRQVSVPIHKGFSGKTRFFTRPGDNGTAQSAWAAQAIGASGKSN
jgi:hypothetical protein